MERERERDAQSGDEEEQHGDERLDDEAEQELIHAREAIGGQSSHPGRHSPLSTAPNIS